MVMLVPGTSERRSRISSSTTSRGRPPGVSRTSISADSTPCTCSSNSALPVRRAVAATSGTSSSSRSMALPSAFDSVRLVPGSVTALMTSAPSLKVGRNARPIRGTVASDPAKSRPAATMTGTGCRSTAGSTRPYPRLSAAARPGSRPSRMRRMPGSRYAHSAGVTVSAKTTSEAKSAIRYANPSGWSSRPSDAREKEQRQEDQHDDERREDDGCANLPACKADPPPAPGAAPRRAGGRSPAAAGRRSRRRRWRRPPARRPRWSSRRASCC